MLKSSNILKSHNLRITQFRLEVLNAFNEEGKALSSNDIESKFKDFDRVTLYRTLKIFEEKGLVHKVFDGSGQTKYAICESACTEHNHIDEHVHFHCNKCLQTYCLDQVFIPKVELPSGYLVSNSNMVIQGRCQKCTQ